MKKVSESEMVELIKNAPFGALTSFSFGTSGVALDDSPSNTDAEVLLEQIRDDKELRHHRDFKYQQGKEDKL